MRKFGFSLIEIVMSIAILTILGAVVTFGFYSFFRTSAMKAATDVVQAELRMARANTIAAKNDSRYGVHFESDRVVLFTGAVYSAADPDNEIHIMPPGIMIGTISFNGGGTEIVFDRLTGNTAQYGSVTLSQVSNNVPAKVISISAAGLIDVN